MVVGELTRRGRPAVLIDHGDVESFLSTANPDRAVLWLTELLVASGIVVVIAVPAPARATRDRARSELAGFAEIFVDPARPGPQPGRSDPDGYEEPYGAELRVPTHDRDTAAAAALVLSWLEAHDVLAPEPER